MKIFPLAHIRAWDDYTITHEPIESLDLMERASAAFVRWFCARFDENRCVKIFCGMGNNGGDGLAIARLLIQRHHNVQVYIVNHSASGSADFKVNLSRLETQTTIHWINTLSSFPDIKPEDTLIDALLGSGLSRPVLGILADVIQMMNESSATTISVDIASGLYADVPNSPTDVIVKPTFTVSFERPKLAFFQPLCSDYVGDWHVIPIGLHPTYEYETPTSYFCTTQGDIDQLSCSKIRKKYAHKGSFGHALLIGGCYGKMGAMVLSAKACLRSGVGLLTVQIPRCGYDILQTSLPEAMVLSDWHWMVNTTVQDIGAYSAIGIGPGLGKDLLTLTMLRELLPKITQALVVDADALNLLSEHPELLDVVPEHSVFTPHPKEFQRLLGKNWSNDYEKLDLLRGFAMKYRVIVCLKGAHTAVALPDGSIHFNTTGNPGMATGGSGDVLTGIITGLLAQGYSPTEAAIFGVFQHGMAGDRASRQCTQPALIASDIINTMGW